MKADKPIDSGAADSGADLTPTVAARTVATQAVDARVLAALADWSATFDAASGPRPEAAELVTLTGDASNRIYVRAFLKGQRPEVNPSPDSVMAMVLPLSVRPPEEAGGGNPGRAELPFTEMTRWLSSQSVRVPVIYHLDSRQQVMLLEDLGDTTFETDYLGNDTAGRAALYDAAVSLLVDFQRKTDPAPSDLIASQRAMDREILSWELEHYLEWRLDVDLGVDISPHRADFSREFEALVDALCLLPTRIIHRDFQSRNIMQKAGDSVLIDYQDAMVGPFIYDLVALLRDSYIVLASSEVDRLVRRYHTLATDAGLTRASLEQIERAFHLQTVQRKLKDTGRFVYIDRVKKNPSFLRYRTPSMGYVADSVRRLPELRHLADLLNQLDPAFGQHRASPQQ